ncbi:hypothetical protein PBCV1_a155R [Paramecium bursaria Chlorella virus 1]|uniref:Uncharacterized protein n=1 Tax=Paramecium bursaria Chlorella virus 1 TaxID=10506 RepID=Q84475_PBCV1|nr:hypothetical protein PBCV1_a155R [Paramecium bursaria Chlorella virus 1]AAC96523.1 hypothetical protein [Paramecium bursaria Chlorella virus 1]
MFRKRKEQFGACKIRSYLIASIRFMRIFVDFETHHDIRSDDDSVNERVRLRRVNTFVINTIFSLSHVDVVLFEEAKERVLVFLAGQTSRFIRIA